MKKEYQLTKTEAKKFLLLKHGLIDEYRYHSEEDVVKYIESVACIQYDPVDVCGKNAELVLQSRIDNFEKEYLYNQLYKSRNLIDYWDKNMSIMKATDFKYFTKIKEKFLSNVRGIEEINELSPIVLKRLEEVDYLTSKDLEIEGKMDWYWFTSNKSKAVLEALFYQGKIVIHHRKGTIRYFSLPSKLFSDDIIQDFYFDNDFEYLKFRVLRRIKGVGLLSHKASYAYIAIDGLNTKLRREIIESLLNADKLIKVKIEDFSEPYYIIKEDEKYLIDAINKNDFKYRVEFLAPLDNLLWDRVFIKELFDFDYTWEIYFKKEDRKYGYYVLPMLYGISFIGRIELIANKKENTLEVKNVFIEPNFDLTEEIKTLIKERIKKFAIFNKVDNVKYFNNFWEI